MALTEETKIDRIEIVGDDKIIQIRETTTIFRDGVAVSTTYNRKTISPGMDYSGEDEEVKAIAGVVHTAQVKANFSAKYTSRI